MKNTTRIRAHFIYEVDNTRITEAGSSVIVPACWP